MISVKSIEQKTMTEEKKREAKKDIFAFYDNSFSENKNDT